jgi:hypothetical protein
MRRLLISAMLATSLIPLGSSTLSQQLWELAASFFAAPAAVDEGCGWDPSGRCQSSPQPQGDAGCGWDPDGRCQAAVEPQADAGCGWDPSGVCLPGS